MSELREKVRLVVAALGAGYELIPEKEPDGYDTVVSVKLPDHGEIYFRHDKYSKKSGGALEIAGSGWPKGKIANSVNEYSDIDLIGNRKCVLNLVYPEYKPWDIYVDNQRGVNPSISVGFARPAEAIAKEIERRLLPEYEVVYAQCLARVNSTDAYNQKRLDNWRRFRPLLGANPRGRSDVAGPRGIEIEEANFLSSSKFIVDLENGVQVEGYVSSDRVDLKFQNLLVDQAEKILKFAASIASNVDLKEAV